MLTIPLQPIPAQDFTVILDTQTVGITLRQLATGLFMNVVSNGVEIVGLVICENLNRIVRDLYLGFSGDFVFYDTTGAGNDPDYTGLGTTFALIYLEPSDLPPGVG